MATTILLQCTSMLGSVFFCFSRKMNRNKKVQDRCVINDPLGQPTVSPVATIVFCCFVLLDLKSTDNMCENNDHYRPWLWVGRVDQNLNLKSCHNSRASSNSLQLQLLTLQLVERGLKVKMWDCIGLYLSLIL